MAKKIIKKNKMIKQLKEEQNKSKNIDLKEIKEMEVELINSTETDIDTLIDYSEDISSIINKQYSYNAKRYECRFYANINQSDLIDNRTIKYDLEISIRSRSGEYLAENGNEYEELEKEQLMNTETYTLEELLEKVNDILYCLDMI